VVSAVRRYDDGAGVLVDEKKNDDAWAWSREMGMEVVVDVGNVDGDEVVSGHSFLIIHFGSKESVVTLLSCAIICRSGVRVELSEDRMQNG
jgi:hypothetical protein